jgi:hypothetical protein
MLFGFLLHLVSGVGDLVVRLAAVRVFQALLDDYSFSVKQVSGPMDPLVAVCLGLLAGLQEHELQVSVMETLSTCFRKLRSQV